MDLHKHKGGAWHPLKTIHKNPVTLVAHRIALAEAGLLKMPVAGFRKSLKRERHDRAKRHRSLMSAGG